MTKLENILPSSLSPYSLYNITPTFAILLPISSCTQQQHGLCLHSRPILRIISPKKHWHTEHVSPSFFSCNSLLLPGSTAFYFLLVARSPLFSIPGSRRADIANRLWFVSIIPCCWLVEGAQLVLWFVLHCAVVIPELKEVFPFCRIKIINLHFKHSFIYKKYLVSCNNFPHDIGIGNWLLVGRC